MACTPSCTPCALTLSGTIVDNLTSLPLAEATVQLDLIDFGKAYFFTTDGTGSFSFNTVTTTCAGYEHVCLTVSKANYRAYAYNTSITCGSLYNFPTISLVPGVYTPTPVPTTPWPCAIVLSGKVTSSLTGKPIAGALITTASTVRTDANGNYSLVLHDPQSGTSAKSAAGLLNVQASGYASDTINTVEFACGGYAVDFSLEPLPANK